MSSTSDQTSDSLDASSLGRIAAIGAAGLFIGSFLPWAKIISIFGEMSVSGTSGDGVITAAAGAVACAALWRAYSLASRKMYLTGLACAGVGGLVAIYDFANVSSRVSEVDSELAKAEVGIGLYLCIAGALTAFIAGAIARGKTPAEQGQSSTLPDPTP